MSTGNWSEEQKRIAALLHGRFAAEVESARVIAIYDELMRSMWQFIASLVGDGGARAIIARAAHLSAAHAPLVQCLRVTDGGLDFSDLRQRFDEPDYSLPHVANAFVHLSVAIFQVLSELTGDVITRPLLAQIERQLAQRK